MDALKLIAVDLDGPLLVDTFSPVMHLICEHVGAPYTSDLERNTFSRRREDAVTYLREAFKPYLKQDELKKSNEEMIQDYFRVREEFKKTNRTGMKDGVPAFLRLLRSLPVTLVCYGGLPETYMRSELKENAEAFERYICTNDFRPGLREIVHDLYGVAPHQALFVDDVNFVAEHAKALGTAFVGVPADDPWSWQKRDMTTLGTKHIVSSVDEIDLGLLNLIDAEAGRGVLWTN